MKIYVRVPNWVGDAVMAIPALEALRRVRPDAEIVLCSRPLVTDMLRSQHFANRTLEYADHARHQGWFGRERFIRELRQERFDVAILLQNAFEAAWVAWRARIPARIGYARDGRSLMLSQAIRQPKAGEIPRHESHYYLELLRRAGWIEPESAFKPTFLHVETAAHDAAEEILLRAGARSGAWRCAIAPGASYGDAKCWAPERFAAVADRLISECDADVILFGSPAEQEISTRIGAGMKGRAISLVGKTSVGELPALLSACSVFVGNDSGAMHVAAAVGLPVVGIFGPTDPAGTAPRTPDFTLIRQPVSCSPCFLRTCPIDHRCMERIDVDSVFRAVQGALPSASERPDSAGRLGHG